MHIEIYYSILMCNSYIIDLVIVTAILLNISILYKLSVIISDNQKLRELNKISSELLLNYLSTCNS